MAGPVLLATVLPEPLLAIDGGTVGVIVFLTISFISWIMNTIQAGQAKQKAQERRLRQQQGGGAPRGQAGRQGDRVKSEIESFLEEVTGQKQAAEQPRPQPRAQQRPRRQPPRPPKPPKLPRKQPRPSVPLASSTSKPRQLGSVRDHVSTYMSNRIEEHVEQDIGAHVDRHIDSHVQDHIGRETATDDHVRPRRVVHADASAIREMLRNRAGVRRAILVSEILTRRTFKR